MPVNDTTTNRSYQKPNIANTLADDVGRLRSALDAIDTDMTSKAPTAGPTFTGVTTIAAGSAAAPSLTFTGATSDTGFYSPGIDQVSLCTGGVEKLRFDSFDGNPLIETTYPTVLPSLDLNFAATKRLDPRVTFSRSSSGTYYDAAGVLQSAATNVARFDHNPSTGESLGLLVEEARTNIFTYSAQFNDAIWAKTGVQITPNTVIAPDGTMTNALLTATSASSAYISRTGILGTTTFSVYVKAGTADYIYLSSFRYNSNISGAVFDIRNGTVTLSGANTGGVQPAGQGINAPQIIHIGNGVYRCSIVAAIGNITETIYVGVSPSATPSINFTVVASSAPVVTTGDVTGKTVYIWGAQLEEGSFPTSYIPTPATFTGRTSTATYYDANGVIQTALSGVARSNAYFPDSSGVMRSAGLLLEAAGTNLLNGSQTFATSGGTQNNWVDTNITRDGTLRTSPDSTANALRVTAAAANATLISSAAIGTSAQRTFSIFLRRVTGTGNIQYTLDNGTTWTTQAITSSWVRYSFPATTANQQVGIRIATSGDAIELWGAQLEESPYATSYIPTTTTTVTRAADTSTSATVTRSADVAQMTGANFSSWYNQSQGSFLANAQCYQSGDGIDKLIFHAHGASTTNNRLQVYLSTIGKPTLFARNSGVTVANLTVNQIPGSSKFAVSAAYESSNFGISVNGLTSVTGGTGSPDPALTTLSLGAFGSASSQLNGRISRLTYYPARLSDATLQTITK